MIQGSMGTIYGELKLPEAAGPVRFCATASAAPWRGTGIMLTPSAPQVSPPTALISAAAVPFQKAKERWWT